MNRNLFLSKLAAKGMTQTSFANAIGVSKNTVGRYVNGYLKITTGTIVSWCEYLDIHDSQEIVDIFLPELSQNETN